MFLWELCCFCGNYVAFVGIMLLLWELCRFCVNYVAFVGIMLLLCVFFDSQLALPAFELSCAFRILLSYNSNYTEFELYESITCLEEDSILELYESIPAELYVCIIACAQNLYCVVSGIVFELYERIPSELYVCINALAKILYCIVRGIYPPPPHRLSHPGYLFELYKSICSEPYLCRL